MNLTGANFIGFEQSSKGTSEFSGINPVDGAALPQKFVEATVEEVNQAVQKAEAAFMDYSHKSDNERADFLEAIADQIMALGDALIERCMSETALPQGRFRVS